MAAYFALFGIDIEAMVKAVPESEQKEIVERAKARAKKEFKRLAMTKHPDKGGDEEEFKKLAHAIDVLQQIEYVTRQERQPRPKHWPGLVIRVSYRGSKVVAVTSTTTSTTATTSTISYW